MAFTGGLAAVLMACAPVAQPEAGAPAGVVEEAVEPAGGSLDGAIGSAAGEYVGGMLEGDAALVQGASHPLLAKRRVATEYWGTPSRHWLKSITHEQIPGLVAYLAPEGAEPVAAEFAVEVLSRTEGTASVRVASAMGVQLLHLARFGDDWLVVDDAYALEDGAATGREERDVASAVRDYARGVYEGSAARTIASCHSSLAKRELVRGEEGSPMLRPMSLEELGLHAEAYSAYWGFGRREGRREVTVLAVEPTIAAVRLEGETWTDLMHLAKLDGRWLIVDVLTVAREP